METTKSWRVLRVFGRPIFLVQDKTKVQAQEDPSLWNLDLYLIQAWLIEASYLDLRFVQILFSYMF